MREAFLVGTPTAAALRAINYPRELNSLSKSRKGAFRAVRLRTMLSRFADSYWSVFTRLDCAKEHGVELITQTDMFSAEPEGRVIRRDSMPKPANHEVSRWQVLIAGAGQMGEGNLFGRSIIADDRLAGRYLGPHAAGLTFEDPGGAANLWTYAFLNTGAGLRAVKSCAFGTSVPGLRLDLLGDLTIPMPEDGELLGRVTGLVRRAVEQREIYLRALRAARAEVESLPEMKDALAMCAERKARAVAWSGPMPTVCAWTYASSGGALGLLGRKWPGRLGDVLESDGVYNGPRFARITCEHPHGIDFLSQRDAFLIRPLPRRIVHPGFVDRLLYAREGTIMVGGHGTLGEGEIFGRAMMVAGSFTGTAFTQDLLRVVPKRDHVAEIYALFTTMVGMRLLRSTAVGTKILSMRLDLLRALPVPGLPPQQRTTVERHVREAMDARTAAEAAEADAIHIVENEVLPKWLD